MCTQLGDPLSGDAQKKPMQLKDDVPSPPLKDTSVRIQVQAAALNFADALQLQVTHQGLPLQCSTCWAQWSMQGTLVLTVCTLQCRGNTKTSPSCLSSQAQRCLGRS